MKKIINGKKYDTETATLVAEMDCDKLFLNEENEWFICRKVFEEYYTSDEYTEVIDEIDEDEAKEIIRKYGDTNSYEYYPEIDEERTYKLESHANSVLIDLNYYSNLCVNLLGVDVSDYSAEYELFGEKIEMKLAVDGFNPYAETQTYLGASYCPDTYEETLGIKLLKEKLLVDYFFQAYGDKMGDIAVSMGLDWFREQFYEIEDWEIFGETYLEFLTDHFIRKNNLLEYVLREHVATGGESCTISKNSTNEEIRNYKLKWGESVKYDREKIWELW